MKHLTSEEIIDFITMTCLDDRSLKNASIVTGHIAECEVCMRRVRAFQTIYDEMVRLGSTTPSRQDLYYLTEQKDAPGEQRVDDDRPEKEK